MQKLLTTKDLAVALGVSESSLRRWTNSGAIGTSRTPGGHRRIPLSEAIKFIRDTHATILKPEILGLPEVAPVADPGHGAQTEANLHAALVDGDAERVRGLMVSMYLGGTSVAALCDGPLRLAMQRIGELWHQDCQGILVEHRATDVCIGAISAIRLMLPETPRDAPLAIGATPPGDPYMLPSAMAAAVLVEAGWRETNFGPQVPLDLLAGAARARGANLVWLSISSIDDPARLRKGVRKLADQVSNMKVPLAIGGRAAGEIAAARIPNVQLMQSMAELSAFARGARR